MRIRPFTWLHIKVGPIDYDFNDGDLDWSVSQRPEAPENLSFEYSADELFDRKMLEKDDDGWILDENALEEFVGDRITKKTGLNHNGFSFSLFRITKGDGIIDFSC